MTNLLHRSVVQMPIALTPKPAYRISEKVNGTIKSGQMELPDALSLASSACRQRIGSKAVRSVVRRSIHSALHWQTITAKFRQLAVRSFDPIYRMKLNFNYSENRHGY